jgi:glycosyltransferase involved in cell wall biosynthesis
MINNDIPISVIIPTKNNYNILKISLPILSSFNEVIIVDTFTNDGTKELVEDFNFTYINFKWNGLYPKKRNWILENIKLKNDWVLFLDSDEFINENFINEIIYRIKNPFYNAYYITFDNKFLGKILKWGDPFKKISLIRHKFCKYEKVHDFSITNFDMEVHENMIVNGNIGLIKSRILHNACDNLDFYILKHNDYAIWESNRIFSNKIDQLSNFRLTFKYRFLNSFFLSFFYFFYTYILRLGFLDGKHGFIFALLKFSYFNNIYIRLKAKNLINK